MIWLYSIQVVFFVITSFLYILVLISLYQSWRAKVLGFNIAFSKLCFVTGVCDLLILTNNNLLYVLPKACAFPSFYLLAEPVFVHIYLFIAWGGGACQALCVLMIVFNRLSTIAYPQAGAKYWGSLWIYLIFGIQTVPGFLIGCITLPFEVQWKPDNRTCSLVAVFIDTAVPRTYFKIAAIFLSIITVLLFTFYAIIILNLKQLHRFQANRQPSFRTKKAFYRQMWRESRLLVISSIICAIQVLYVIYIALREITKFDQDYIGVSILGDVCAGINPYLLLIFSPLTRKHALGLLSIKTTKIKVVPVQALSPPKPSAAVLK